MAIESELDRINKILDECSEAELREFAKIGVMTAKRAAMTIYKTLKEINENGKQEESRKLRR